MDALSNWPETKILILSHVQELLQQDAEKILLAWPEAPLGIYSAGLRLREIDQITVAGVQSVHRKADMFGHLDLVIVDEAHLINHKAEGMYRRLIDDLTVINPDLRVIGLTATPYRLGHGLITDDEALFDALIDSVTIEELVERGFLAPLRSKLPESLLSTKGVKKRGGEYVERDLQKAVNKDEQNRAIVAETIRLAGERKAWLFFCAGVDHSYAMRDILRESGIAAETVTGETPQEERARILEEFKAGKIRAITNNLVLSIGFDYPDIDVIAFCRPTMSPGLYLQMAGRGMRIKSHTDHCLVLDFAGNVAMHGPITAVQPPSKKGTGNGEAPVKVCEQCHELCHLSAKFCPACEAPFPEAPPRKIQLHNDDIMGLDEEEMEVSDWRWWVHVSRNSGKSMLRVTYYGALSDSPVVEYLTVLHDGYAGQRANQLLSFLAQKAGADLAQAKNIVEAAEVMNAATPPEKIKHKKDGKFRRITYRKWPSSDGA